MNSLLSKKPNTVIFSLLKNSFLWARKRYANSRVNEEPKILAVSSPPRTERDLQFRPTESLRTAAASERPAFKSHSLILSKNNDPWFAVYLQREVHSMYSSYKLNNDAYHMVELWSDFSHGCLQSRIDSVTLNLPSILRISGVASSFLL